mmetsp:Transcript_101828/g.228590  ORF Transcript_101828/g.228590 Transcript_101828/m.228590 type:complete len:237 (-) Transcript_101828:832-1542(-)
MAGGRLVEAAGEHARAGAVPLPRRLPAVAQGALRVGLHGAPLHGLRGHLVPADPLHRLHRLQGRLRPHPQDPGARALCWSHLRGHDVREGPGAERGDHGPRDHQDELPPEQAAHHAADDAGLRQCRRPAEEVHGRDGQRLASLPPRQVRHAGLQALRQVHSRCGHLHALLHANRPDPAHVLRPAPRQQDLPHEGEHAEDPRLQLHAGDDHRGELPLLAVRLQRPAHDGQVIPPEGL